MNACFRKGHRHWLIVLSLIPAWAFPAGGQADPDADERRQGRRTPVVEVFEACREAVVNISATQFVENRGFGGLGDIDAMFEEFFDMPRFPRERVRLQAVGSGFILHEDGYIVTNAHVVTQTAERKVVFADGSEFDAEIIAIEPASDLAILKIDTGHSLPTLPLGRSDDLMVGETVIAIGNPLGYQHTVTAGVVSALERVLDVSAELQFTGLIQTDASINPGNSGGPLLNIYGELIGVNTAIRGDAQNIGFAIPVDQLRAKLPELLSIERRYRVETGLALTGGGPVRVDGVAPASAAVEAGIRPGDQIVEIDGQPVENLVDFHIGLLGHRPGDQVDVKVMRGSTTVLASLELRERPLPDGAALSAGRLGVILEEIGGHELDRIGLRGDSALRVAGIERGSPAEALELREGDLLVELNGQFPATLGDIGVMWEQIPPQAVVRITIMRVAGNTRYQATTSVRTR
jgi:serine protease Do